MAKMKPPIPKKPPQPPGYKTRKIPWYIKLKQLLFAATLITTWPNGTIQRTAAIDNESCDLAAKFDLSHGATSVQCIKNLTYEAAGFKSEEACIKNFNCQGSKR